MRTYRILRGTRRRRPLTLLFAPLLTLALAAPVCASSGYYALDHAAEPVKAAAATALIAIARAGDALVAVGLHGAIVVSRDNGKSWVQAHVPVDLTLTDVYFSSPTEGWATGHYGTLLHSTDGGMNWHLVLTGAQVIAAVVQTASAANAAVPASPTAAASAIQAGAPAAQPAGPWAASADTDQRVATAYQKDGPSKPFLAVGACGGGLLAGGQQDMAMFSPSPGAPWTEWTSKIQNPNFNNIYSILPDGNATLLVGEGGMLLRSDAGCQSFQTINGPFTATLYGAITGPNGTLVVYGLQGDVYISNDDGKTWKQITISTDAAVIGGVTFGSGQMLLAATNGDLFLGSFGSTNFTLLSTNVPGAADLALAANGDIVVAGAGGITVIPVAGLN